MSEHRVTVLGFCGFLLAGLGCGLGMLRSLGRWGKFSGLEPGLVGLRFRILDLLENSRCLQQTAITYSIGELKESEAPETGPKF